MIPGDKWAEPRWECGHMVSENTRLRNTPPVAAPAPGCVGGQVPRGRGFKLQGPWLLLE